MRVHRASDATTAGAKKLRSQRDAAKLSAGQRRTGLTWGPPRLRQRSLPALNFRSHRDLTEFFNSLLEHVPAVLPAWMLGQRHVSG